MTSNVHPQAPTVARFRVRPGHRDFIARCFGVMYAHAELCHRGDGHTHGSYAPVALGPGDVPVLTWPAIELRREWLERLDDPVEPPDNVLELRRA